MHDNLVLRKWNNLKKYFFPTVLIFCQTTASRFLLPLVRIFMDQKKIKIVFN